MVLAMHVVFLVLLFIVVVPRYYYFVLCTSDSALPHKPKITPSLSPSPDSNNIHVNDDRRVVNDNYNNDNDNNYAPLQSAYDYEQSSLAKNNNELSLPPPHGLSSSVTFLYELYEHEIYNQKTNSWSSKRYTQSPITGGGGRDSTSLNPQTCSPPRNYLFDGEWKIDMANNSGESSKDGFGWDYYVGKYDGLGRRRRRWVRSLIRVNNNNNRISSHVSTAAAAANNYAKQKKKQTKKQKTDIATTKVKAKVKAGAAKKSSYQPNFKGFSWGIFKSLIYARSFGVAFRIPLSANFDWYDKFLAAPYISSSTYFGYPLVMMQALNASIPLEGIRWLIGGIIWKIQWSVAIVSALIRSMVEAVVWTILWPWRLWTSITMRMMSILSRSSRRQEQSFSNDDATKTSSLSYNNTNKESIVNTVGSASSSTTTGTNTNTGSTIIESGEGTNVSIETHIEIRNNSSEYNNDDNNENGEEDMSAVSTTSSIVGRPRGGGASSNSSSMSASFRRNLLLTIAGKEMPTFHRTTDIEYSTTLQGRIGISVSWRISQERGYEYRCNFFYSCLPTPLFWGQLEKERIKRIERMRKTWGGRGRKNDDASSKDGNSVQDKDTTSSLSGRSKIKSSSPISSFLADHSSTLGVAGGYPLPVYPHFGLNLMLSMSQFYYGWLLRSIKSLFVLPLPGSNKHLGEGGDDDGDHAISQSLSSNNEKLVSFALKKNEVDDLTINKVSQNENGADSDDDLDGENCTELMNVAGV